MHESSDTLQIETGFLVAYSVRQILFKSTRFSNVLCLKPHTIDSRRFQIRLPKQKQWKNEDVHVQATVQLAEKKSGQRHQ